MATLCVGRRQLRCYRRSPGIGLHRRERRRREDTPRRRHGEQRGRNRSGHRKRRLGDAQPEKQEDNLLAGHLDAPPGAGADGAVAQANRRAAGAGRTSIRSQGGLREDQDGGGDEGSDHGRVREKDGHEPEHGRRIASLAITATRADRIRRPRRRGWLPVVEQCPAGVMIDGGDDLVIAISARPRPSVVRFVTVAEMEPVLACRRQHPDRSDRLRGVMVRRVRQPSSSRRGLRLSLSIEISDVHRGVHRVGADDAEHAAAQLRRLCGELAARHGSPTSGSVSWPRSGASRAPRRGSRNVLTRTGEANPSRE